MSCIRWFQEIGTADVGLVGGKGANLGEMVPADKRDTPALSDTQVAELVALGRQVEAHYEAPQDIEWAYAGGQFYILQSRPITALAPAGPEFPTEGEYNRTMFVEIFPDPLSPIFLSVIQPLFEGMLDFTFEALGFRPPQNAEGVEVFYNQPYFHRDYTAAALQPLSPAVRERLVSQIVNPFGEHEQDVQGELSPAYLGMVARLLRFMTSFPAQLAHLSSLHYERNRICRLPGLSSRSPDYVGNTHCTD